MVDLRHASSKNLYKVNFIPQETDEKKLLIKIGQGDRNAFWSVWKSHQNYLYHRCLAWMGGSHDDAQEVMSLASLKAWEKLPNHALNITNLKGWLNRFVHNLCVDIHRQRQHRAIGVDNVEDIPLNDCELISADYPESELLQQELNSYLQDCINSLSPRLREPLILNYYQGKSHRDIGKQLSISQNNVAKRIQEAREILKKSLEQYFAGLNTKKLNETQCQELEQQSFFVSNNDDSNIEEINYRITISCLETLSPVWLNFHHHQDWI